MYEQMETFNGKKENCKSLKKMQHFFLNPW